MHGIIIVEEPPEHIITPMITMMPGATIPYHTLTVETPQA